MPFRLLLADANDAHLYLVQEALSGSGVPYYADTAKNGEEALQLVRRAADGQSDGYQIAVLDLNLTTHSGIDVLREIRRLPAVSDMKVAIFTSSDSPRDQREAREAGADGYIRKPMEWADFLEVGKAILQLAGIQPGQEAVD